MKPNHRFVPRHLALTLSLMAAFSLSLPASSMANALECTDGTFPCGAFTSAQFTKVPSVFKFQARVSQAKLPIGKGVFSEVIVKVLEGSTSVCTEKFQNVEVRDSVLNLEIGLNMSCELDEILATSAAGLALQVCLGSANSCLKPIELASVPYSVKSSFSFRAGEAGTSEESAVSHYTYRAAADRDLLQNDTLATGYFDFVSFNGSKDGYLTWTPVATPNTHNLTLAGRKTGGETGTLETLDSLTLESALTTASGELTVQGNQINNKDLSVTEDLAVSGQSSLAGLTVSGALVVTPKATFNGGLEVPSGSSHQVIDAAGAAIVGTVTSTGMLSTDVNAQIGTTLQVGEDLWVGDLITMRSSGDLVSGPGTGALQIVQSAEGTNLQVGPAGASQVDAVEVVQRLVVDQGLEVPTGAPTSTIHGDVTFTGTVRFQNNEVYLVDAQQVHEHSGQANGDGEGGGGESLGDWSFSGAHFKHGGQSVLQGTSGTSDLIALGGLTVNGQVSAKGLNVSEGASSFTTETSFAAKVIFKNQMVLSDATGADQMVLFQRGGAGEVYLVPSGVNTLKIQSPTTFTGSGTTTTFEGSAHVQDSLVATQLIRATGKLAVGADNAGWVILPGQPGIQHETALYGYQTVMGVDGSKTLKLNPDAHNGQGFTGGTHVYGALEAHGQVTLNGGVLVDDLGKNVAQLSSTQTRFYTPTLVNDGLTVKVDEGVAQALKIDQSGVELGLGLANTETSVTGAFKAKGAATFEQGIGGQGLLDVQANENSCMDVGGYCSPGYFSIGAAPDGSGGITNRCCRLELK